MNVLQGSLVRSLAGHDKGSYYVVVGVEGKAVLIADGKEHKLERLKKKNMKHIKVMEHIFDLNGITNKKLRKLINENCCKHE